MEVSHSQCLLSSSLTWDMWDVFWRIREGEGSWVCFVFWKDEQRWKKKVCMLGSLQRKEIHSEIWRAARVMWPPESECCTPTCRFSFISVCVRACHVRACVRVAASSDLLFTASRLCCWNMEEKKIIKVKQQPEVVRRDYQPKKISSPSVVKCLGEERWEGDICAPLSSRLPSLTPRTHHHYHHACHTLFDCWAVESKTGTRPDLSWLPGFPTRSKVRVAAGKTWRVLMWLVRLHSHRCWACRFCVLQVCPYKWSTRWGLLWPLDLSTRPPETSAGCEGMLA